MLQNLVTGVDLRVDVVKFADSATIIRGVFNPFFVDSTHS
jgi:hypothetical protein